MITPHRKQYMREYRKRNRKRLNEQLKEYLKRTGKKYYDRDKYRERRKNGLYVYKYEYKKKTFPRQDGELRGTNGVGRKYEKIALFLLKGSKDCNADCFLGKWDIEWNGLKIDVKMRNLSKRGVWGFTTHKNPQADYYLLFCVENDVIIKVLFIPKEVFGEGKVVTKNNCYLDKYKIDFSGNMFFQNEIKNS